MSRARIRFTFNPQRHVEEAASLGPLYEFAGELAQVADNVVPEGREKSLAFTKLEEFLLWCERGLTNKG